ncbi:sulfite reductase [Gracilibacillus boraciitolerans JCM 21714]|uniref:Sulfite reductase n=1 Tax=Gracilibacillus boraciitolerans JCM 21714 TaxID=1298598 RepID=W4VFV1_9BACI|nr:sulfite reductase [Gracilibacillus boraciitolerans JCM 21714]
MTYQKEVKELTLQVVNSPFDEKQTDILNQVLPTLTDAQKNWLAGYLAASQTATQSAPSTEASPKKLKTRTATILYGSETGNCQAIAERISKQIEDLDRTVTISSMDDYKPKKLKEAEDVFIITATHGEGDPPDNAIQFHEFLHSRKAPKLDQVQFSVLSLGDESYEHFCQTGKDFDKRLEELGAKRIYPRVDCDVDYEELTEEWTTGILDYLKKESRISEKEENIKSTPAEQSIYSKSNPFTAEVLDNILLSGKGSNKETRHIEISLDGSHLQYEPGDCLAICPKNDPSLVQEIMEKLDWNPEQTIPINKQGGNSFDPGSTHLNF